MYSVYMKLQNITVNKKEKSMVEIGGEISSEVFESYRESALRELGHGIEIDGFRKGSAPQALIEKQIPEMHVLEEMAQRAIQTIYPTILEEHDIQAIGAPAVKIKKIAKGSPLVFALETAVIPEFKLPDYVKIAGTIKKEAGEEVSEKEIEDTLLEIRKMHGHKEAHGDQPHEHTDEEFPIPDLTDEFVQKLGDFKTVEDFKNKVKENLGLEKEGRAKSKTRAAMLEKILSETPMEIPNLLVEYELDRFMEQMKGDISRMGLTYEDYLKHLTKTEDEMRESYKADTEKKIKTEFILAEIGKVEKLEPDPVKVGEQVEGIMQAYQNVDKLQAEAYVKNMLQNETVIEFLESKMK